MQAVKTRSRDPDSPYSQGLAAHRTKQGSSPAATNVQARRRASLTMLQRATKLKKFQGDKFGTQGEYSEGSLYMARTKLRMASDSIAWIKHTRSRSTSPTGSSVGENTANGFPASPVATGTSDGASSPPLRPASPSVRELQESAPFGSLMAYTQHKERSTSSSDPSGFIVAGGDYRQRRPSPIRMAGSRAMSGVPSSPLAGLGAGRQHDPLMQLAQSIDKKQLGLAATSGASRPRQHAIGEGPQPMYCSNGASAAEEQSKPGMLASSSLKRPDGTRGSGSGSPTGSSAVSSPSDRVLLDEQTELRLAEAAKQPAPRLEDFIAKFGRRAGQSSLGHGEDSGSEGGADTSDGEAEAEQFEAMVRRSMSVEQSAPDSPLGRPLVSPNTAYHKMLRRTINGISSSGQAVSVDLGSPVSAPR